MTNSLIKSLQISEPRGRPLDMSSLRRLGISSALAHGYVKSGWLERLGRGLFMFAGDTLHRDPTLSFLEGRIQGLHVAAKTALAWHDFRQNVAQQEKLILWGTWKGSLPSWFTDRFQARYTSSKLFDDHLPAGFCLSPLHNSPNGPTVSTPERALLEMLSELDTHESLEETRNIMESVRQLRTKQLSTLIKHCRMIKAVRLCVIWAEELSLPWAEAVRQAVGSKPGNSRWVKRLKDGRTLILNP
jgi:hypothetical protein